MDNNYILVLQGIKTLQSGLYFIDKQRNLKIPDLFLHQFKVCGSPCICRVGFYQAKTVVEDLPGVVESLKGIVSRWERRRNGSSFGVSSPGAGNDGSSTFRLNLAIFKELKQIRPKFGAHIQGVLGEFLHLPFSVGHSLNDDILLGFLFGAMGNRNGDDHQQENEAWRKELFHGI